MSVYITERPLLLGDLLAEGQYPQCGGLAVFGGTVRNHHLDRPVLRLRYTAYEPVAARLMREIEDKAREKFGAPHCRVVHRIGMLEIGDTAIYCVTRAPHRAEAFAACRWIVDEVKHTVPVWKEEFYADGTSAFVQGCCIRADAPEQQQHHPHHHSHHEHA